MHAAFQAPASVHYENPQFYLCYLHQLAILISHSQYFFIISHFQDMILTSFLILLMAVFPLTVCIVYCRVLFRMKHPRGKKHTKASPYRKQFDQNLVSCLSSITGGMTSCERHTAGFCPMQELLGRSTTQAVLIMRQGFFSLETLS